MERTQCKKCGKWAIKIGTGIVLASYPPQYPMIWKCDCGWTEPAETIRGQTNEEFFKEQWDRAQQGRFIQ